MKAKQINHWLGCVGIAAVSLFTSGQTFAQVAPKDATEITKQANAAVLRQLPFADK
jgi:hypothetical protein